MKESYWKEGKFFVYSKFLEVNVARGRSLILFVYNVETFHKDYSQMFALISVFSLKCSTVISIFLS